MLKLTLALAAVVAVAGGALWLLEDEQGRDDIENTLRDLPLVGDLMPDAGNGSKLVPAPGSKQLGGGSGGDGPVIVYPVK